MVQSLLPVNGHAFISYLKSIKEVHRICLGNEVDPEYRKILNNFENCFNCVFDLFQLNMTLKIHVIIHHYADYFELSGLTFKDTNGEYSEALHSRLRIHEERSGFKVVRKKGTIIHQQKSLQSLTTFNSKRAGLTSSTEFRLRKKRVVQAAPSVYRYKKSFVNKYLKQ